MTKLYEVTVTMEVQVHMQVEAGNSREAMELAGQVTGSTDLMKSTTQDRHITSTQARLIAQDGPAWDAPRGWDAV